MPHGRIASNPDGKTNMNPIENKLKSLEKEFGELEILLADSTVMKDRARLTELSRRHAELLAIVQDYRQWQRVRRELEEVETMLHTDDLELAEIAHIEMPELRAREARLHQQLERHLIPKDPFAERNTIMEIRAGTGGEEASLFAGDLFRMYARYAEDQNWKVEILSSSPSDKGGFKEIIFMISGPHAYSRLRFEGGTHRVQRIPITEASGRIHTSAATVAVLPEAEDVEVDLALEDLRVDVFRSSGPGGQSVNTTDSAVRITHVPTGIVVTCQDEKSQHKNKARALKVLRSRLLEIEQNRQAEAQHAQRRSMVGSGDRSGRIRTYNYPQNRLTDHRINLTLHRLERIMEGDLNDVIDALVREDQLSRLHAPIRPDEKSA